MINNLNVSERISVEDISEWFKQDIIIRVNNFNERSAALFADAFSLAQESGQSFIPIVIDSFGGDLYSALSMADLLKTSKVPIVTVAMGKAMSAGAVLLTCGDEGLRFASPMSTIMIHDVCMDAKGKVKDIEADSKEGERLNRIMFNLMEKNCGLERGHLLKILRVKQNSTDWYITPTQAKKLNIVNHIRVPKLMTRIIVESELL